MGNFDNLMKNIIISVIFATVTVVGCGPGPQGASAQKPAVEASKAHETLPHYDSTGVISAVNGQTITLDHDGASGASLAAGRNDFTAYADVLAEAPLDPGSRVAFKFRRNGADLELAELKAR